MTTPSPETPSFAARSRWLRWGIAVGAILVLGLVGPAAGWYGNICEEQLSDIGTAVTVCHAPGLTDLPVLAAGLAVLLLLWPDLSEVSIGFVSLKRFVEERAQETDEKVESAAQETRVYMSRASADLRADLQQTMSAAQNVQLFNYQLAPDMSPEQLAAFASGLGVDTAPKAERRSPLGGEEEEEKKKTESPLLEAGVHGPSGVLRPSTLFLVEWSNAEAILSWAEQAQILPRPPGWTPGLLLGYEIHPNKAADVAKSIEALASRYSRDFQAARSARNLVVHDKAPLPRSVLSPLTEKVVEFVDGVRRRVEIIAGEEEFQHGP